ncbi:hypothetical protein ACA910_008006 [Epithemia clementina (nom. ined.)]
MRLSPVPSSAEKTSKYGSGINSPSHKRVSSGGGGVSSSRTPAIVFTEIDVLQRKDVLALLAWLESFSAFGEDVLLGETDDNANFLDMLHSLDQPQNLRGVGRVTAEILEGSGEGQENRRADMQSLSSLVNELPQHESPWEVLLEATQQIARPDNVIVSFNASETTAQLVVKVRVLANLLDCVVNHPNLNSRRQFIARILKLPKNAQRHLMGMIERRIRAAQASPTPLSASKHQQLRHVGSSNSSSDTPSSDQKIPTPRPILRRPNSTRRSTTHLSSNLVASSSESDESLNQAQTPPRRRRSGLNGSPDRTGAATLSPVTRFSPSALNKQEPSASHSTTPRKLPATPNSAGRRHRRQPSFPMTPGSAASCTLPLDIMSPTAVIDSPETAQLWIQQLQKKNQELQGQVSELQEREQTLQGKQEDNRQEMMKLESTYINKQTEMEEEHKTRLKELQKKIDGFEKDREKSSQTEKELKRLQDELEVANHSQTALSEAQERLRTYKERMEELQDVKEALEREQEAHGKAVEDMLRLQNEVKGLQQSRRQLDDYKTRAIEAEVKLVECQESLRRLELELADVDELKNILSKESIMQKQQLQEMVHRIKEETQRSIETTSEGLALGEGVSELNPQVRSELTRLRHENLHLRAFAAKRQDDVVEQLESKLDDSRRLADKYKQEYLNTKDNLQSTESELNKTRKEMSKEVDVLKNQVRQRESRVLFLTEQLEESKQELEKTKDSLSESNEQNSELQQKVKQLTGSLHEQTGLASKSRRQVDELTESLKATKDKLQTSEKMCVELQETSDSWEKSAKAMEVEVIKTQEEIQDLHEKLNSVTAELGRARSTVAELEEKLERAHEHNRDLDARFDEESQSNAQALEATKAILTSRYKQQLEDQSTQFTRLLEEKRSELERVKESSKVERERLQGEKQTIQEQWKNDFEKLQEELTAQISKMQDEHQQRVSKLEAEVKQAKDNGEKKLQDIVRKGRVMINDLKANTREELKKMDDENRTLDEQLQQARYERKQFEENMRMTVGSLKSKLEQSTMRVNALTQEADDLQEQNRSMKVAMDKLKDDNDRYRRQLSGGGGGSGGRFGAQQFEKLKKEFNAVVEENRNLRRQARMYQDGNSASPMDSIAENSSSRRDRGSTITQMRQEYEETITALNDEKRELVMKNTAAMTEVERAEKRTWEREQEVAQLKSQMTSLKLELERIHMNNGADSTTASLSSFNTGSSLAHGGVRSPPQTPPRNPSLSTIASANSPSTPPPPYQSSNRKLRATRSPNIDRALREKEQHENLLRQQISSLRRTPTRKTGSLG